MNMCVPVILLLLLQFFSKKAVSQSEEGEFGFNGYLYNSYGIANLDSNGLLTLTNSTSYKTGQVFYNLPVRFKNSKNGIVSSFSTTFVFAIVPEYHGHGMTFVICPTKGLPYGSSAQHLGLFNLTNDGDPSNHIVAVEFDTFRNQEFGDIDSNHVGIDINGLQSEIASTAGYYKEDGTFKNMSLEKRKPIQAWVEYDSSRTQLNVTLHPPHLPKPKIPLLSLTKDLSPYLLESMYVGFTSSTCRLRSSQYILGWTFKLNGEASNLDISRLPKLPDDDNQESGLKRILAISLSLTGFAVLVFLAISFMLFLKRKKLMEVLEDWEVQFGPHRFAYKDLYVATKGFKNSELLGKGGFGKVYKGTLLTSKIDIAVKRVSHDSRQGMREFVAEIATIGRLRHPNLVRLLGYCRRKGELYLVYDCMPKGSLDKFLYNKQEQSLACLVAKVQGYQRCSFWSLLFSPTVGSSYHSQGQTSKHSSMNAKLGDFGLAKLCDHGIDPQTSNVAGTFGYISPELSRTGKASTSSDVFAFGVLMLEITCGRRPVLPRASSPSQMVLTDWVLDCWEDEILRVVDERLKHDDDTYIEEQITMVLKLGLLCSHPVAAIRPSMSSVVQFLDGVAQLPPNLTCLTL
ncbi:hypothetical protein Bca101_022725 [Brassica carinata]